ncbi:MAG: LLM class flavin-dependent oxidoreductase, partial [Alphaproteobacteria bacterium]|nr:LLM class flavin-dependent oxidoreductase [Alphaproteobacteria bacterium]
RFLDTFAVIGDLLARTERLRLFPAVASLPLRHPAMLAKLSASLPPESPKQDCSARSSRHRSRCSRSLPQAPTGSGLIWPTSRTSLTCWLSFGRPRPVRHTCCTAGPADRRAAADCGGSPLNAGFRACAASAVL